MLADALLLLAFTALLFIPLEVLVPMHRDKALRRPGLATDLLHVLLSGFLIRAGFATSVAGIGMATAHLAPVAIGATIRSQPDWLQFIELFVLSDLCFYVGHRLVHAVPWLWRFHAVHHSSEQLDWLASFRVHPVDQILNASLIALPGIALGFGGEPLLLYALLYRWHSLLLHSNVRISLGPLDRLIATPHFHHWHHADQIEAHDRNFGGQTLIWDRLFRTAYVPPNLPDRYGVSDPLPRDYVGQLLAPFTSTASTKDQGRETSTLAAATPERC
ncbi:sterol desaturase family protein [Sphingomonas sp. 37zxx]|uniref:sterol desaturase family protein n=1 Tax=Sphingomonas sp. 37zxx TaxID=1550073 RepID=UPI00068DDE5C|nr:sterol desaturase family protein [Sphingomonas sp. 37zxx]